MLPHVLLLKLVKNGIHTAREPADDIGKITSAVGELDKEVIENESERQ